MTRIMEQRAQLETNQSTIASVAALKQATAAQQATMQEMNIDNVMETLDQISDANAQMTEINDALANPIGMGVDLDEDEMMKELEVRLCLDDGIHSIVLSFGWVTPKTVCLDHMKNDVVGSKYPINISVCFSSMYTASVSYARPHMYSRIHPVGVFLIISTDIIYRKL